MDDPPDMRQPALVDRGPYGHRQKAERDGSDDPYAGVSHVVPCHEHYDPVRDGETEAERAGRDVEPVDPGGLVDHVELRPHGAGQDAEEDKGECQERKHAER